MEKVAKNMELTPNFKLGITNAWILALVFVILRVALSRKVSQKTEGRANALVNGYLVLLLLYSIFLPLQVGTIWFYGGLSIFIFGVILLKIAGLPWASKPAHKPVTTGLYRYSRHPYYLAMFIQLIGIGLASTSMVFLLALIILIVPMNVLMGKEEAFCLEMYGQTYREYMEMTPRWIRILGLRNRG